MPDRLWDFIMYLDGVPDPMCLVFNTYENAAAMRALMGKVATDPELLPDGCYRDDNGRELSFRIKDLKAIQIKDRSK